MRQQALLLLADVMHKRENLASALREGMPIERSDHLFVANELYNIMQVLTMYVNFGRFGSDTKMPVGG